MPGLADYAAYLTSDTPAHLTRLWAYTDLGASYAEVGGGSAVTAVGAPTQNGAGLGVALNGTTQWLEVDALAIYAAVAATDGYAEVEYVFSTSATARTALMGTIQTVGGGTIHIYIFLNDRLFVHQENAITVGMSAGPDNEKLYAEGVAFNDGAQHILRVVYTEADGMMLFFDGVRLLTGHDAADDLSAISGVTQDMAIGGRLNDGGGSVTLPFAGTIYSAAAWSGTGAPVSSEAAYAARELGVLSARPATAVPLTFSRVDEGVPFLDWNTQTSLTNAFVGSEQRTIVHWFRCPAGYTIFQGRTFGLTYSTDHAAGVNAMGLLLFDWDESTDQPTNLIDAGLIYTGASGEQAEYPYFVERPGHARPIAFLWHKGSGGGQETYMQSCADAASFSAATWTQDGVVLPVSTWFNHRGYTTPMDGESRMVHVQRGGGFAAPGVSSVSADLLTWTPVQYQVDVSTQPERGRKLGMPTFASHATTRYAFMREGPGSEDGGAGATDAKVAMAEWPVGSASPLAPSWNVITPDTGIGESDNVRAVVAMGMTETGEDGNVRLLYQTDENVWLASSAGSAAEITVSASGSIGALRTGDGYAIPELPTVSVAGSGAALRSGSGVAVAEMPSGSVRRRTYIAGEGGVPILIGDVTIEL